MANKKLVIIKRHGHNEPFDERKVYGSVYAACRASHRDEQDAERIAKNVSERVTTWTAQKLAGTPAHEIFLQTAKLLHELDVEAAFMYETHRDIS